MTGNGESDVATSSSIDTSHGFREGVAYWILVHGDRRIVAGLIVVGVSLVIGVFIWAGILSVGPDGFIATLFGSGLTSGVITLMTIALSINQLILTRVFGSPDQLDDRLNGTRDVRHEVEKLAEEPSSPNDPAEFLALIATTLQDRSSDVGTAINASAWQSPTEVTTAIEDIGDYGAAIDERITDKTTPVEVLEVVLGSEYAYNMTAIHQLQNKYDESLPEDAKIEFQAIEDLLESIAIIRQFFKTIALQQDFARLSLLIVYSGMVALVVTVSLTLVYQTDSVTVPSSILPVVISLGIGVIVSPLAAFVSYIFRAAVIANRTVSVGPFIPPRNQ